MQDRILRGLSFTVPHWGQLGFVCFLPDVEIGLGWGGLNESPVHAVCGLH